ncbi:hypothetical protein Vretimale_1934, partial [Volvox reticuliferus]
ADERAPRPAPDAQPFHQDAPMVFPYQAAAGVDKTIGLAPAGSTAALTRAASGFRSHGKGIASPAPPGGDVDGRKGNLYAGDGGGEAGDVTSQTAVRAAASALPESGSVPARAAQHGGLRGMRRPQVPLQLQPYHGVRSYMSNASASQLSAGVPGGAVPGWPWRPPAQTFNASGAAPCTAGGSPAPSVASSQFSNLAAPYQQYYPVPVYYAQQQQLRHIQQQQYRRMYEHLMYGAPSQQRKPVSMGGGATAGLPASPISPPYDRRMANLSASVGAGGGMAWQDHSLIHPFDMYGSYSGMHYHFPFHGSPVLPFPHTPAVPPLHPHPSPHLHAYPNPQHVHSTTTAYASAPNERANAGGSQRPRGHSQPSCNGDTATAPQPPSGGISGADENSGAVAIATAAAAAAAQSATKPSWRQRYMAETAQRELCSDGMDSHSAASPTVAMDGGACQGDETKPPFSCGAEVPRDSSGGPDAAGDGWGSGVSGLSGPTGGSKSIVATTGPVATAATATVAEGEKVVGAAAAAAAATDATCSSIATSDSGGPSASAHVAGSGSATTAAGYGSDILDLRGLEVASAALADEEDDPLGMGGFVKLPQPQPGPEAAAASALGTEAKCLEDADGFGLVPGAAPPSRPLRATVMMHHQHHQPAASGSASGSGSAASALMPRRWAPQQLNDDYGAASEGWYNFEAPLRRQQQQQHSSNPVTSSQHLELRPSECAQRLQMQGQEGDTTCSQMYYSADYYATSPYDGIDEYAMYGGVSSLYGGGGGGAVAAVDYATVMNPSLHPPMQLQLLPHQVQHQQPYRGPLQTSAMQQQQQQSNDVWRQSRAASGSHLPVVESSAPSLRFSVFGGAGRTTDTANVNVRPMAANVALSQSRSLQASQLHSHSHIPGGGLPLNETSELRDRVVHGHSLLQHLYDSNNPSVHREMLQ